MIKCVEYYKFKEFIKITILKMNEKEKQELKTIIKINMLLYNNNFFHTNSVSPTHYLIK